MAAGIVSIPGMYTAVSPTVNFGLPAASLGMLAGLFEIQTTLYMSSYRESFVRSHSASCHTVGRKRRNGRPLAMSRCIPGSMSYAEVKYRCSLLPAPVVSGSEVYWIDQTISLLASLPIVQRSLYLGTRAKRELLATAESAVTAAAMSGLVASAALGAPARVR